MPSIYYKIGDENSRWLDQQAAAAGITKAQAIDIIVTAARTEEWVLVRGDAPRAERPGRPSPAAGRSTCEGNC